MRSQCTDPNDVLGKQVVIIHVPGLFITRDGEKLPAVSQNSLNPKLSKLLFKKSSCPAGANARLICNLNATTWPAEAIYIYIYT